ncbi:MAG: nucleotidyltransferase domain-containing protein [Promethearchaeota archaeon]
MEHHNKPPNIVNSKENDLSILDCISEKSRNYIIDVFELIKREVGIKKILSIILFGSQRTNQECSAVSDCDLLIIFKNRVSNWHIREIERYFLALEIKHDFKQLDSRIIKNILDVIEHSTGMFKSHFLTKEKFWEQCVFHKIFKVNRVFSAIFAPKNLVLGNVLQNSSLLYGKDIRKKIKPKIKISIYEIIKSTVMNLIISIFATLISPFKHLNPIKYQLEAIKWSLRASNFYCFGDSESLEKIISRFISFESSKKQEKAKKFFLKFMELRNNPKTSIKFIKNCPIRILKIHGKAIAYKKMIKPKEIKIPNEPPKTFYQNKFLSINF